MENLELIEHQKDIADELIEKMYVIDPNCYVFGGAPRSWLSGEPCNDIDVYYYYGLCSNEENRERIKTVFGVEFKNLGKEYQGTHKNRIASVLEGVYKGVKVNFISWTEKTFSVTSTFPTPTAKFSYHPAKRNNHLAWVDGDYLSLSHAYAKEIYFVEIDGWKKYYRKMATRYPDCKFYLWSGKSNSFLDLYCTEERHLPSAVSLYNHVENFLSPTEAEIALLKMLYPSAPLGEGAGWVRRDGLIEITSKDHADTLHKRLEKDLSVCIDSPSPFRL